MALLLGERLGYKNYHLDNVAELAQYLRCSMSMQIFLKILSCVV